MREPETEQVVTLYLAGSTVYELASQFGVHRHTGSETVERKGVSRRYQNLSPEQIATARSL
jgi:transposase